MKQEEIREKMTILIDKLLSNTLSEQEYNKVSDEISRISPYQYWSDLIFWTNDYVDEIDENLKLKHDEFFDEVFNGSKLNEEQKKQKIKGLLAHLITNDFSGLPIQSSIAVSAEIDRLSPDKNWWAILYSNTGVLNPEFLDREGDFNYELFVEKLFD